MLPTSANSGLSGLAPPPCSRVRCTCCFVALRMLPQRPPGIHLSDTSFINGWVHRHGLRATFRHESPLAQIAVASCETLRLYVHTFDRSSWIFLTIFSRGPVPYPSNSENWLLALHPRAQANRTFQGRACQPTRRYLSPSSLRWRYIFSWASVWLSLLRL